MKKSVANVSLKAYDDIFSNEQSRIEEKQERVQEIKLSELHAFKNHPFKVKEDELMQRTLESISAHGVLVPVIARPIPDGSGGYEIVSGHRRHHACELVGKETIPAIIREMDDDAATILMVDSNLQREEILPSERAFAFKMKLEAIKHQGQRNDLTLGQLVPKFKRSTEQVAEGTGESYKQIQRYIRLTELIPELLAMVDEKKIAFNPAVELSYLSKDDQHNLLSAMDYGQSTPSLSQAQRMKKLSQDGKCSLDVMCSIMLEDKKTEIEKVIIKDDVLRKYFPKSYTPRQMENVIIKLLEQWQKKRQRDIER